MIWKNLGLTRTLNYWRARHLYWRAYNFDMPIIISLLLLLPLLFFSKDVDFFSEKGIISKFSQYLSVLAPFYLASLAAVATFSAPADFDKELSPTVVLNMRGKLGVVEPHSLTMRHFLSLLLGYCCVASMGLFLFSIMAPFIYGLPSEVHAARFFEWVAASLFMFFFAHTLVASILAIYYLADRLHRK